MQSRMATNYSAKLPELVTLDKSNFQEQSTDKQLKQTGCAIGTICGAYLAAYRDNKLLAVLAGLLMYEIAAENAAAKDTVNGPGTFLPAFLDEIHFIWQKASEGDFKWAQGRAKIEEVQL